MGAVDKQAVYAFLRTIPAGRVVTYSTVAAAVGHPRAARAIGAILHVNPDGNTNPCYKVVRTNGRLSAAYAFGGLAEQKRRLEADGVKVEKDKVDISKYGWRP